MRPGSKLLLVVTLSVSSFGCASTWRPVAHDRIETTLKDTQPDVARVQAGEPVIQLHDPLVRADSLRGTLNADHERTPVSISVAAVDSLWLRRKPARPAAAIAAGAFGAALIAMLVFVIPHGTKVH